MQDTARTEMSVINQHIASISPWEGAARTFALRVVPLLEPLITIVAMRNGQVLYREGEYSDKIFLVYSGKIRLSTSSTTGRPLTLRVARQGDILGLSTLFSDKPCQSTAEVIALSRIGVVDREEFFRFLDDHPDVRLPTLQVLSAELSNSYTMIRAFASAPRYPRAAAAAKVCV
jgi:cAMP-binding proteins - catabolite gene activator and regulatory subunit of cAMP-dependent protein kinases